MLRRSLEAEAMWDHIYNEIADDESGGLLGAATARADAQVHRFSVAHALTDASSVIEVDHLKAGWALWRYCENSAKQLFGDRTGDDVEDRLLAAILTAGDGGLDATSQHAVFGRNMSARRLDLARASLEDRGLIYTEKVRTDGRPRILSFPTNEDESTKEGEER